MSDYRRLISYLYAYEGGVKGANTGYAKIEVRNGQCRIYVNVRRIYLGGNDIGVYLLAGDREICIGKIFIRSGSGEFRTTVNAQNIDGAGLRMEMCHGLTIHDVENAWKCYTTIWEDAVAHAAEIDLAEVTSENARKKEAAQEKANREKAAKEKAAEEKTAREKNAREKTAREKMGREGTLREKKSGTGTAGERSVEEKSVGERTGQEKRIEKIGLPGNSEKEKNVWGQTETTEISEKSAEKGLAIGKIEKQKGIVLSDRLPISAQIEKDLQREEDALKDIAPWDENSAEKVSAWKREAENPAVERSSVRKSAAENPAMGKSAMEKPSEEESPTIRSQENRLWSRMQREYAKVLAFDYDKGCEILSIKPQDIGLLPREVWIYGNNSFLLHGYYHYRHLILARLEDLPGEPRYLLGVPGRYYSNEKNMAAMFGFPNFVPARKQPDADGKFGYWYTLIRL